MCAAHHASRQLRDPSCLRDGIRIFNGSKMCQEDAKRAAAGSPSIAGSERMRDSAFLLSSGKDSGRKEKTYMNVTINIAAAM